MEHHHSVCWQDAAWTLERCWVVTVDLLNSYTQLSVLFPLECAKGMHLYDGSCYQLCPGGTYATERSSRRRNLTFLEVGGPSVVMKRQGGKPTATEAFDMEPLANYSKSPLYCLPCHYSCATCSGPHNSQCSSCLEDAQLFNLTDFEPKFYCYPNAVLPQIDMAKWHYSMNVKLLTALVVIISCILLYALVCVLKRFGLCWSSNYNSNIKSVYEYNKLAVDEQHQSAIEIEEEIHKALNKYSSESESEEEANL